ncbi:lytic murein transglycosylase [Compostimonas suwonensis]|uniref:Transglycosylase protein with SLT domain n=1 Tax=Compostimonas suwonensis TaxID=1048394 RepID=A0A2M9BCJ5_9MICO|nr:lytic murein transglycosylase [Compostimonas suwonensis]PJJ55679.1 transglycosylase protein with SLT domain [Compostimonas suwonensis]
MSDPGFYELLADLGEDGNSRPPSSRSSRVLAVVLTVLALSGAACIVMATMAAGSTTATDRVPTAAEETTALDTPRPDASGSAAPQTEAALASPTWIASVARRTGIPARAMSAYAGAVLLLARESPACGLSWNALAAIGEVESHHGSIDGARIHADGRAEPEIIGIALSGGEVGTVPDTDGGVVDGDPRWDRAVGPMQFIPSTWASWGIDGDGDGRADPHDIDDAAVSAARYLCAMGGDLSDADGWRSALTAYNDSAEYAVEVTDTANRYVARAGAASDRR